MSTGRSVPRNVTPETSSEREVREMFVRLDRGGINPRPIKSVPKETVMDEQFESDTTTTRDDLRDAGHDANDELGDMKDDAARAADHAKDKASEVGHKASDAIEDMIPGDSDGDGH